jgi:hypothetical protein
LSTSRHQTRTQRGGALRTFTTAVDVHAREPIVPDETSLCAVCDVSLLVVEISLRKPEIDHVYRLMSRLEANDAIPQLHVPM